jgi:hypothetical protein
MAQRCEAEKSRLRGRSYTGRRKEILRLESDTKLVLYILLSSFAVGCVVAGAVYMVSNILFLMGLL